MERGTQSVIYDGLGDESDWEEDLFAGTGRPGAAGNRPCALVSAEIREFSPILRS